MTRAFTSSNVSLASARLAGRATGLVLVAVLLVSGALVLAADDELTTAHAAALEGMFGNRTKALALPKVTAGAAISAAEILRKALEARWGAVAASNLRSFRALGRINLDNSGLATSSIEYAAKRPNQYRLATNLKSRAGQDLGRYDQGFDGKTGRELKSGTSLRVLKGNAL